MKHVLLMLTAFALLGTPAMAQIPSRAWMDIVPQELVYGQVSELHRLQPADNYSLWNPSLGMRTEAYTEGLNPNIRLDQYGWWRQFVKNQMLEAYTEETGQEVIDRQYFRFEINKNKQRGKYGAGGGFMLNVRSLGYGSNQEFQGGGGSNQASTRNYSVPGPFTARVRWGFGYGYNVVRQYNKHLYTRLSLNIIGEPAAKIMGVLINPEASMVLSYGKVGLHLMAGYNYSYMKGVPFDNYAVKPSESVTYKSIRVQAGICFAYGK